MIAFRSAMRSHVGHIRELNEDSAAALPERGLWVWPTAWAGTSGATMPASWSTSSLERLPPTEGAVDLLRAVQATLARCNHELHATAARTAFPAAP